MKFDDFVYKKKSGRSCHFPTVKTKDQKIYSVLSDKNDA